MIDPNALERLYTSYGFETTKSDIPDISIFIYKKSRYFGVDIIPLYSSESLFDKSELVKSEYSKSGYAADIRKINTIEEAEIELFRSFFAYESTVVRVKKKYTDFTEKQKLSLIDNPYEYVESPFELHNHQTDSEKGLFDVINTKLASAKPELVIIEAAAGYGKTCTAFEILSKITSKRRDQLPIFTELSRNRSANIFRYVLLDEIDLEFPSLSSGLVIKEIKNGRIPLIIDGFDELLEKVDTEVSIDNSFEDVESMLDTIGNLLEHKAKVILTTRKTAIFVGIEFENWLNKWKEKFEITRIALKEPRIRDWLGEERFATIKEKNIPIQNISNPVLLTFLKHLDHDEFLKLTTEPEHLIKEYFDKMLNRERERQELLMSVENQLMLFKNVARNLLEMDSSVEDKDFFKMIILEDNKKLLEETKSLYTSASKRTVENLVDTLSTHALLDRKGRDQNQIGFINDFIFGTFIGEILVDSQVPLIEKKYSNYMLELAVTAFRVQSLPTKEMLWEKLEPVNNRFATGTVFLIDIYLKEELVRDYHEITVNDVSFVNVKFFEHTVYASVFMNCYFKNCTFDPKSFSGVSFISCTFSGCQTSDGEFLDKTAEVTSIKSVQDRCQVFTQLDSPNYTTDNEVVDDIEKEILRKLWLISHTKGHHITKLLKSFDRTATKKVYKSLKGLQEKGFLDIRGIHVYFPINQILIIKQILNS